MPYFETENCKQLKKLYDEFKFEEAAKIESKSIRAPYWKAKAYFNFGDYKSCLQEIQDLVTEYQDKYPDLLKVPGDNKAKAIKYEEEEAAIQEIV